MEYSSSAGSAQPTSRYFPETGCLVEGAFLEFFDRYGVGFCGLPITNRLIDQGVPTQYFQRLGLEEPTPGQVRLKALGDEVLRLRQEQPAPARLAAPLASNRLLGPPPFALVNPMDRLPQHATARYPSRPLEYIRHLIIHHTGVPASVGPEVIAGYHVTDLDWPGIGYHFVVDAAGQVYQTNALTTAAYHARQFNSSGVGIALLGNFTQAVPPPAQLDGAAELCAWLLRGLDLPLDAVKGHRELIAVTCPGETWLQGPQWKESLLARVAGLLRGETAEEPASLAAAPPRAAAWPTAIGVAAMSDAPLPLPPLAPNLEPAAVMWSESAAASTPAPAETEAPAAAAPPAETTPVAPVAPLAPTSWAESAEQSIATAAMVAALNPPAAPVESAEDVPSEPLAPTSPAIANGEAAPPAPAPVRPWWMPVSEPFPAPEAAAQAEPAPSVTDTVPLDVTPTPAPQTDDEDVPFFPRPRPDTGESQ